MGSLNIAKPCIIEIHGLATITDKENNDIFYKTKKGEKYVSLPKGNFDINTEFKKHYFKRVFTPKPTKEREKDYFFRDFAPLIFGKNPNTASVYHKKKEIVFDTKLKDKPFLYQAFILYHEIGHKFYQTEWKCDVFGVINLLEQGYNQSQLLSIVQHFLKKYPERLKQCEKVIKKSNLLIEKQ